VPRRTSRSWTFTTVSPSSTSHAFSSSWLALSTAHAGPWPSGRWGRTALAHRPDELVAELALAPVAGQPASHRRLHEAPDRLAVHRRQPGHAALTLAPQPQPQHLTYLVHLDLSEAHRHLPGRCWSGGDSNCRRSSPHVASRTDGRVGRRGSCSFQGPTSLGDREVVLQPIGRPVDGDCVVRPKADTDSGGIRTPVPDETGHSFRLIPDT